jgi:hypothetical protein
MYSINEDVISLVQTSTSRLDLWIKILGKAKVKSVAEIGVWKGEYAEYLLSNLSSIEKYFMIDPWANLPDWNKPFNVEPEAFELIYNEAIQRTAFAASKLRILRGRTKEVVSAIQDESLDFVYIDGDHTLKGITIDLYKVLPKVKINGLIGGDDFMNTPWQHDFRYEPTLVFPYSIYFSEAHDLPIYGLPFNQFLIQKRSNSSFSFVDLTGSYFDLSINKLPKEFC